MGIAIWTFRHRKYHTQTYYNIALTLLIYIDQELISDIATHLVLVGGKRSST